MLFLSVCMSPACADVALVAILCVGGVGDEHPSGAKVEFICETSKFMWLRPLACCRRTPLVVKYVILWRNSIPERCILAQAHPQRTRNGCFAFTLMREKIFNEKNGLSSGRWRRRNACFSLSLLPKNLSKVGSGGGWRSAPYPL